MKHSNIDPEFYQTIEQLKSLLGENACFDLSNLEVVRSMVNAMSDASIAAMPPYPNVNINSINLHDDELDNDVQLQIYTNTTSNEKQPVILYLHGGGFVMGAAHHAQANLSRWCDELGVTIASVEYRLAPEHPFPAALNDCFAALKWLSKDTGDQNIDTQRIAIVGDSAGGGLAAGLSLYARDHSDIPISFQLLMWPMLDPTNTKPVDSSESNKILWNQANNKFAWDAYLKTDVSDDMRKYAIPFLYDDLSRLPPTFIGVGDQDLFFEENQDYATRLKECGVHVDFKCYSGGFHGFAVANPAAGISKQFNKDLLSALKFGLFE